MRLLARLGLLTCLAACTIAVAGPKRDITLDDYFTQSYINGLAISPDGKWQFFIAGD